MLGLAVLCTGFPTGHHDPSPWMADYDIQQCVDRRPPPEERAFVSGAVDDFVYSLSHRMKGDATLACLLRNTLPNTLDTTVKNELDTPFIVVRHAAAQTLD